MIIQKNRTIGAALQAHLDGYQTTLTFLLKIEAHNGIIIAVTNHDVDIPYNDGAGEVTYRAEVGLDQASVDASSYLDVDNSESTLLLVDSANFDETDVEAGVLDAAKFWVYRVNWEDLSQGHYLFHYGTTGAVRVVDGIAIVGELRGLSQSLKQNFLKLTSKTCNATFGSQPGQERKPCMFDASTLWTSDTVLSVDSEEPDRIFTATTTPTVTGPNGPITNYVPGLVKFTSGQNAGAEIEIEEVIGDEIKLRFPLAYDIAATDGYDIRPDCAKRYLEDCIAVYDNGVWFRGQPLIVEGDEASQVTPGATGGPFGTTQPSQIIV